MRLCVYAIMRDEANQIAEWAETTGDADTRFVLDTGSTDGTTDELLLHGIGFLDAVLDPFRFDDARNMALALAPAADLYLRLDADERLPADWRQIIDEHYHPEIERYRYRVRNTDGIWRQITRDDLHARPGFRWKYPTHEVLVGPPPRADIPLVVEHTSLPAARSHHLTNLSVLRAARLEYPGDHRMAFYYARECWYQGRWDDCRDAMVQFLDLPHGWDAERCEAYRILAAIDDDPERWMWKAVGECPARREPWVDLCRFAVSVGERERAQFLFQEALARPREDLYTTDARAWGDAMTDLAEQIEEMFVHV